MEVPPQPIGEAPGHRAGAFSARLARGLSGPLSWGWAAATIALMLGWLAATNHWLSWTAGLRRAHGNDEPAYLVIARAFPGLPGERIADQHAQRWPVHWSIGGIADVASLSPQTVYRWAAIALVVAVCCALAAVLMRVGASAATGVVALAVFALNIYALRYYGLAPGYLADVVFDLGLVVALLGLVVRRLPVLLLGLLVGVAARQTMVPVVLVAAGWVAFDPGWRALAGSRWARVGAVVVLPLAVYLAVDLTAAGFSKPGPSFARLTILDAVVHLSSMASGLANHFAHWAIGLLAVTALLAVTLVRTGVRGLPPAFWGSLAIGVVIVGQAALLNPDPINDDYWSTNEPRLVAIGLAALAVAFALARGVAERTGARPLGRSPGTVAAILMLFAIGSLHHIYTTVSTGSKQVTLALAVLCAVGIGAALARSDAQA